MSKIIQLLGSDDKMFALTDDGRIYKRYVYTKYNYSEPTYRWIELVEEGLPKVEL